MLEKTSTGQIMPSIVRVLVGATVLALLSGCGTLYQLEISARNPDQSALQGSYVLVPGNPDVSVKSAEFEKVSNQVERGLSGSELRRLPIARLADADMAIVVDYQVGEPEEVGHSSKVPMFQTRTQADSEDGTKEGGSTRNRSSGGRSSPGVVDAPPVQELIGTQTYTFVRTQYWRDLSLRAITFDLDGPNNLSLHKTGSLWTVMVATAGSSSDLDEVMPVMIAAAKPYIGVHSEEPIFEKMNGIDRRIKAISEGR